MTTEAELNPANAPIPARKPSICHGPWAIPIRNVKIAMPSVERSTISLRP